MAQPTADAASWLAALRPALDRLDACLNEAGPPPPDPLPNSGAPAAVPAAKHGAPPLRGLPVSRREYRRHPFGPPQVTRERVGGWGASLFSQDDLPPFLQWLAASYSLAPFDLDVLLLALAPEIDQQYEAQYAALQVEPSGQPGPPRPTVGLALELLGGAAGGDGPLGREAGRARLDPHAPLLAHRLLRRVAYPRQPERSELADLLIVDEAIANALTGQGSLPARLAACASLLPPAPWPAWMPDTDVRRRGLATLLAAPPRRGEGVGRGAIAVLEGPPGCGAHAVAQAVAGEASAPLLLLDLERAAELGESLPEITALAGRTARFGAMLLLVSGLEAVRESAKPSVVRAVLGALAAHPGRIILTGHRPWPRSQDDPPGLTIIALGVPDFAGRRACWTAALAPARLTLPPSDLDQLASRFRLTPGQVTAAVGTAQASARWRVACSGTAVSPAPAREQARSGEGTTPTLADFFAAARAHSSHGLASVARQIPPRYGWDDIILPPDQRTQLREVASAVSLRHVVQERWGFGARLSGGKGLNILFAGPSGTGKTMAAEVLARELALDLFAIDLSRVVSKYIGETEKNLDRVFTEAEASNAILFFDEADALFGKRSEVKDAHDRYANIETGYLLQKMEEYEGVAILATNLRANLDEAFARRMHALVEFPFPDEALRARIWQTVFPPDLPLGPDVDAGQLARAFKLSGGNIRNVALTAAYLAADDESIVTMRHLTRAARREYQKLGRTWDEPLLGAAGFSGRAR